MGSVELIKEILGGKIASSTEQDLPDVDIVKNLFFSMVEEDVSLRGQLHQIRESSENPEEVARTYCLDVIDKLNLLPIASPDQGASFVRNFLASDVSEEESMQARAQGFSPERYFSQLRSLDQATWKTCVASFYEAFGELSASFLSPLIVVNPYVNEGPKKTFWRMINGKDSEEKNLMQEAYSAKASSMDSVDLLPFFEGVDLGKEASKSLSETGDYSVSEEICFPGKIASFGFEDGWVTFENESGEKGTVFGSREAVEDWLYHSGHYVARKALRDLELPKGEYIPPDISGDYTDWEERYSPEMRALAKRT